MIRFHPHKISFWSWLRVLFTGRRIWLAVQSENGVPQRAQILTRKPKGAKPLPPKE